MESQGPEGNEERYRRDGDDEDDLTFSFVRARAVEDRLALPTTNGGYPKAQVERCAHSREEDTDDCEYANPSGRHTETAREATAHASEHGFIGRASIGPLWTRVRWSRGGGSRAVLDVKSLALDRLLLNRGQP